MTTDVPHSGDAAWRDAPTRRALALYVCRSIGLLVAAVALMLAGSVTLADDGDTKAGLPQFLPFVFFTPGLLAGLLGLLSLMNAARMTWVVTRHPWRGVPSHFEALQAGTPNGQPVLYLAGDRNQWTLTPATLRWRWARFGREPQLLLAARPGRGGLVATPDRRSLVWGGRSLLTTILLRRRNSRAENSSGQPRVPQGRNPPAAPRTYEKGL